MKNDKTVLPKARNRKLRRISSVHNLQYVAGLPLKLAIAVCGGQHARPHEAQIAMHARQTKESQ